MSARAGPAGGLVLVEGRLDGDLVADQQDPDVAVLLERGQCAGHYLGRAAVRAHDVDGNAHRWRRGRDRPQLPGLGWSICEPL